MLAQLRRAMIRGVFHTPEHTTGQLESNSWLDWRKTSSIIDVRRELQDPYIKKINISVLDQIKYARKVNESTNQIF